MGGHTFPQLRISIQAGALTRETHSGMFYAQKWWQKGNRQPRYTSEGEQVQEKKEVRVWSVGNLTKNCRDMGCVRRIG